ncbi:MAG TPA: hypothetical protein VMH90_01210 [Thermoplasmata archaeon]|nr:hypothetical protein [Thermoplasmata archaeon]
MTQPIMLAIVGDSATGRTTVADGGLRIKRVRDAFASRVYREPGEALRRRWKVGRDCARRSSFADEILAKRR